ncbi:hypothetical protein AC481_05775 [miscellaneous Crenarchaeota group archaeon SMTZ-80]|nr:MAG: hypothetical protein AC481_05775 [miscellaneous Crenarchaeota group archaeon SMTZ-80]
MSKKEKPSVEELHKKIMNIRKTRARLLEDVKDLSSEATGELEEMVMGSPLESAAIIFLAGLVLGVLVGTSTRRR